MKLWTLWGFDNRTGAATRPVGAAGVDAGRCHISLIPLEPAVEPWRDILHCAPSELARRLAHWEHRANGVTMGIATVPAASDVDVVTAVERLVDDLLCLEADDG